MSIPRPKPGIHFQHNTGATGKRYLPETLGSGVAFVDLDGDGWADILFINGKDFAPRGRRTTLALYHNNRNGTFTDITRGSGLDIEMYGFGVAVADYDNDGRPDIYITALEGDRLFHNEGNCHFRDVTAESGIHNVNFGTSAAWFDYDKDGKADLDRRQLRHLEPEDRSMVHARRRFEIILHARILQRNVGASLSQSRQWQV